MASSSPEEKFHGNESDDDEDADIGGPRVFYELGSPNSDPQDLHYCKPLVDLAIDSYNQKHSEKYRVVDLVRVVGCACAGFYFYMKFTAKHDGADPITLIAEVYDGISEATVDSVYMVDEDANLPIDVLPACSNPCSY